MVGISLLSLILTTAITNGWTVKAHHVICANDTISESAVPKAAKHMQTGPVHQVSLLSQREALRLWYPFSGQTASCDPLLSSRGPRSDQAHNCTTTPVRFASSIHFISYFHNISLSPFTAIISKSWLVSKQVYQNGTLLGDKIVDKTSETADRVIFCLPRRNEYKPMYVIKEGPENF